MRACQTLTTSTSVPFARKLMLAVNNYYRAYITSRQIHSALLKPGADVIIVDEGQRIKDKESQVTK